MKTLGNIIWIIFGGLHIALEYFIAGLVLMITIIGIPFGLQSMNLGMLAIWPFGTQVKWKPSQPGCLSIFMNVLWFFVGASGSGSPMFSTVSSSASPSSASPSERCTSDWQSWPCHHSERSLYSLT